MLPFRARPLFRRSAWLAKSHHYTTKTSYEPLKLSYDLYNPSSPSPTKAGPILFLHGLFGSRKNNRSMSKVFARDLRRDVYALDLRNHGASPHSSVHDYDSMSSDVENFLTVHELRDATLVGHSMGAKVAMAVALRQKVRVANLVSIDNAPIDAALKSSFGLYVKGMRAIEAAKVQKLSEADEILKQYETEVTIRQFLLTNLVRSKEDGVQRFRIPVGTLAMALDHMADFPFKEPEEARWEGPALFVRGTKSHYVPDEVLPIIGRFFPKFEVRDIDAGHWVVSEKPEDFRTAVVDWLSDKE